MCLFGIETSPDVVYPDSIKGIVTSKYKFRDDKPVFKPFVRVDKYKFHIPGLGVKGEDCGAERGRFMSVRGDAVKFKRLSCKRVECPDCWSDWMRRHVFNIAMRLATMVFVRGELPVFAVFSVPPDKVSDGWCWDDVNTGLFRRGYRRGKMVGVECGYGVFHPYRIKKDIKKRLWDAGYGKRGKEMDAGLWMGVREDGLGLGDWHDYVNLSPHAHGIVFGSDIKEHSCKDYVIRFKDKDGVPLEQDMVSVVGYLVYLLSHAGVTNYKVSNAIRSWGEIRDFVPEDVLPSEIYMELAHGFAEALGMVWDSVDGLGYPDDDNEDVVRDWVSIHSVYDYLGNEDWVSSLSMSQLEYWKDVASYMGNNKGKPPPIVFNVMKRVRCRGLMLVEVSPPKDVVVVCDVVPKDSDNYG